MSGGGQTVYFDHERLDVYQEAIALTAWLAQLLDGSEKCGSVREQLDRASTSVVLNIAEGNGKYSPKDRCRFLDIAHGSALECAAALDILVAKQKLTPTQIRPGKEALQRIVSMLFGLIKRNSPRTYHRSPSPPPPPTHPHPPTHTRPQPS